MNKRFVSKLAAVLCFTLGFNPSLLLAAAPEPGRGSAAHPADMKLASGSKKTKPAAPPAKQEPAEPKGQSVTPLADGRLLLIGGKGADAPQSAVAISDARAGQTLRLPNGLHEARAFHTATTLPDGKVLVYGGVGADDRPVASAEVFDPASQTFELLAGAGTAARAYHTATLLTDGRVLLAGGVSAGGRTLADAELWEPANRTAAPSQAKLSAARRRHRATLLPDGNVLIEGGVGGDANAATAAELFDVEAKSSGPTALSSDTADANPPYLAASLPASDTSEVPVDGRIALRFSKPLRVETVTPETVKLSGPEGLVAARVVPAENGRLAFITPGGTLLHGSVYTVSLAGPSDGINALVPATVSFKTEDKPEEEGAEGGRGGSVNRLPVDADWEPDADSFRGDWKSKQPRSKWQDLAPLQAEAGATALAGQALTLLGQPLANLTLRVAGRTALTDNSGRFLLKSVPAGRHTMWIDGRTAGGGGKVYGIFKAGVDIAAGRTNVLPFTIWVPRLDMAHATTIPSPTRGEVVITHPRMPGLELRLPPGTVIRDIDGKVVTQVSITPIPTDRPPFPLPPGYDVPVFFTIQPGGALVIPPRARVIYPNYTGERPGARLNFWNNDPEEKGWYIYGQGTVSPDGRQVIPDPGVAIYEFSGIMISGGGNPPPNGPNTGGGPDGEDGDPVDLGTGLFVMEKTDVLLHDTMPLELKRTYRPGDNNTRAFGIGSTHAFEMFLWSVNNYQEADLILPSGGRVHYVRTSSGTGYMDAVYEHTSSPGVFHKSKLKWNSSKFGWDLVLKDGTVYYFPDMGRLESITDRAGNTITVTRAGSVSSRVTQLTSPNGRWIKFTYDGSDRITEAKDNIGRTVGYQYDSGGRLWKVTNPKGGVTEYSYDTSNRMLTIKDARGIVYLTNEYDSAGRVTKQTQADSTTYQFAYTVGTGGKITQTDVTDPRGKVRRVTFNAAGYTLTSTRALGTSEQQAVTYERQSGTNLVESVTDALGRRTEYTYDASGNITGITLLAGTSQAVTTSFTYEPTFNRVASVEDPLDHTTSFAYDDKGNLTAVTSPSPLGHETTFDYDAAGQLVSMTDPLQHTTQFNYEAGLLVEVIDPLGRSTKRYSDSVGRLLRLTDPLGHSFRYEYDSLNLLTRIIDPRQGETAFTYDANGNLLTVTDALSGVTSYTYNNMDRLSGSTDPLQQAEAFEYDAGGRLTKHTDRRGKVTTYVYDNLGRKTFVGFGTTGSGGGVTYESTVSNTYDAGSRLTQIVDSQAGTTTLSYDNLDRLTSDASPKGTVSYGYDAAGRRTSMTVAGQTAVNYSYDNADRLTGITRGTSGVTLAYDAAGRRTSVTLPNGVVMEYDYDAASQLTGVSYELGSTALGDLTYEYDAAGRRVRMGGSFARTALPQALASATYDAAHQLTQRGASSLTYDANGNMTSDGANSYSWDARNRLVGMSGTGLSATFQYDPFGRRSGKTVNGTSTGYLYDGHNVVQELSGTTPVANMLTGRTDEVFTRSDAAGTRTLLTDGLLSTLALLDSAGAAQTEYTYDPFGKTTATGSASGNPSQYTGRENDGTGLHFYRARYYHPTLQRFVSRDPIGFAAGDVNLYAYVGNNPINLVDPFGLDGETPIPTSPPPTRYEIIRDYLITLWNTGIPVKVGAGRTTTMPVPGGGEAIATLQLGPELYNTLKIVERRNKKIDEALRCAQGNCSPGDPDDDDDPGEPGEPGRPGSPGRPGRPGYPNDPGQSPGCRKC